MATQIPPFLGLFSLLLRSDDTKSVSEHILYLCKKGKEAHLPIVIEDGGRESSSTDPIAHYMDPFTEPQLNPKNTHINKHNEEGTISMGKVRYGT